MTSRERFLAACRRQPVDGPHGWVMRQAGRYLPEYRKVRARHPFMELVETPELAAEVTLQPIRRFDGDAAVVFCDILVPPAAMGIGVDFVEGRGPVLKPVVRTADDVRNLRDFDAATETGFLAETLRRVRTELGEERQRLGGMGLGQQQLQLAAQPLTRKPLEHALSDGSGDQVAGVRRHPELEAPGVSHRANGAGWVVDEGQ